MSTADTRRTPAIAPITPPFDAELQGVLDDMMGSAEREPLALFRTIAHNRELARAFTAFGGYFLRRGLLSARERELVAREELRARELATRSELARAYFRLTNSARLVSLYRDTLLPQAMQAQQSAEELYRTGAASIMSVIETTATLHNFQLSQLRATADYYQDVARIERVLGAPLELPGSGEINP